MSLPVIDFDAFSWEAFATLTTGLLAVAGAVLVGLRQVGISDRQSRIMERQVGLDELKLRSDLFDRRFAVYEATREFLIEIMAHADEPKQETQSRFRWAMDQSQFLFTDQVANRLQEIWTGSCAFFVIKKAMQRAYAETGDYGQENIEREYAFLITLSDTVSGLSDVFAPEMGLATLQTISAKAAPHGQKL